MQGVFDAIGRFFTDILSYISEFALYITALTVQIFVDIWELLTDIPSFFFDQILKLINFILSSIPFPDSFNFFSSLPDEVLNMVGLLGLANIMALIISALLIRVSLQLIPFTRLGS